MGEAGDGEPVLRALGAVLGDLAGLGYDAEWSGVRAADAGAPHNRFRVFIIAYARGNSFAVSEGFRRRGGALGEAEALRRGNTVGVRDQVMDLVAGQGLRVSRAELLPTPNTMEHREAKTPEQIEDLKKRSSGGYRNIWEVVINELLPTPIASEGTKQDVTVTVKERINTGHQVHLTHIARSGVDDVTVWGRFEPAIRRWEAVLGRSAPAPTKPDGKDGAHRLSSEFTEWMMGLPAGWVTGCGLSRNDELKACGNGVVPAQAILALRMLLDGIDPEREREKPVMFPTPTVSDIYTDNLASSQQKDGSMHSVTLPQAVQRLDSSGEQS
jgi:DNA (cytosine-5)-methyltransferase 1